MKAPKRQELIDLMEEYANALFSAETDWGSDVQIELESAFYNTASEFMGHSSDDTFFFKATSIEIIQEIMVQCLIYWKSL